MRSMWILVTYVIGYAGWSLVTELFADRHQVLAAGSQARREPTSASFTLTSKAGTA